MSREAGEGVFTFFSRERRHVALLIHRTAPNTFDLTLFPPHYYLYKFVRLHTDLHPLLLFSPVHLSLSRSPYAKSQLPPTWEDHLAAIRMVSKRDPGLLKRIRNSLIISRKMAMETGGHFLKMPVRLPPMIEWPFCSGLNIFLWA